MSFTIRCLCREKEIEEKIGQLDVKEDSDRPAAYRPPGARDRYVAGADPDPSCKEC